MSWKKCQEEWDGTVRSMEMFRDHALRYHRRAVF